MECQYAFRMYKREKKEENAARFEGKGKEGRKAEGEREREKEFDADQLAR